MRKATEGIFHVNKHYAKLFLVPPTVLDTLLEQIVIFYGVVKGAEPFLALMKDPVSLNPIGDPFSKKAGVQFVDSRGKGDRAPILGQKGIPRFWDQDGLAKFP